MAHDSNLAALTIATYLALCATWSLIVWLYVRARRAVGVEEPLLRAMLGLLGLDAVRSLLESSYFAAVWAGLYGLAFARWAQDLSHPLSLFAIKALNLVIALALVTLLFRRFLPADLEARRQARSRELEQAEALRRTFDEVRCAERRWQLAVEATNDDIFEWDRDRSEIWVSPSLEEKLGLDRASSPTLEAIFERLSSEDRGRYEALLDELRGGTSSTFELEHDARGAGGTALRFSARAASERDAEGALSRVVVALADVTELRAAEQRQRDAQRLETLALLAGSIAHDFNNVLTVVLANLDLARAATRPEERDEALDDINSAALSASQLVRQLLLYGGGGRAEHEREPADPNRILEDIGRVLTLSVPRAITLDRDLGAGLPAVAVDPAHLQQIVMNLVHNASDAIGERRGTIRIRTRRIEDGALDAARTVDGAPLDRGPFVELSVEDSGEGMSEEAARRVFEPFFSTKGEGRGMGLAALASVFRRQGLGVQILSTEGRGTTFRVLVPVATPPVQAPSPNEGAATAPVAPV